MAKTVAFGHARFIEVERVRAFLKKAKPGLLTVCHEEGIDRSHVAEVHAKAGAQAVALREPVQVVSDSPRLGRTIEFCMPYNFQPRGLLRGQHDPLTDCDRAAMEVLLVVSNYLCRAPETVMGARRVYWFEALVPEACYEPTGLKGFALPSRALSKFRGLCGGNRFSTVPWFFLDTAATASRQAVQERLDDLRYRSATRASGDLLVAEVDGDLLASKPEALLCQPIRETVGFELAFIKGSPSSPTLRAPGRHFSVSSLPR